MVDELFAQAERRTTRYSQSPADIRIKDEVPGGAARERLDALAAARQFRALLGCVGLNRRA